MSYARLVVTWSRPGTMTEGRKVAGHLGTGPHQMPSVASARITEQQAGLGPAELAASRPGDGIDALDRARDLERREPCLAVRDEIGLRDVAASIQHDEGQRNGPPACVGPAHDHGVDDRRMLAESRLDFGRIDV